MTALSTSKTWRKTHIDVAVNEGPVAQNSQSTWDRQNRQLLFEIKEALITGLSAWTVVRSCGYQSGSWSYGNADYGFRLWQQALRVVKLGCTFKTFDRCNAHQIRAQLQSE